MIVRSKQRINSRLIGALSGLFVLTQLYFLYIDPISPYIHGLMFVCAIISLTFLKYPTTQSEAYPFIRILDWVFAILALVPFIYAYFWQDIASFLRRGSVPNQVDINIGLLFLLLLLEAARRVIGLALPVLASIALLLCLSGLVLPEELLIAPELSFRRVIGSMFQTELGVFSQPTQVAMRWIFVFLVFGQCLLIAGGKQFFIRLAMSVTGKLRGGPAYMAVISSALFGSLSGSNMANVMVTGQVTIPWIIRAGFSKTQAAAIESVASTAGALTPPIMGAGALIMAEYTGVPYATIILAALLPAILYYIATGVYIWTLVHRYNIKHVVAEDKQPVIPLVVQNWPIVFGIGWLVYRIVDFYPLERAALEACAILLVGGVFSNRAAYCFDTARDSLLDLTKQTIDIGLACATAGILVGAILITGWGVSIASLIVNFGEASIYLALLATMVVTIVLGMGTPGIAAYIITAAVVAAPLAEIGLSLIAVHMFIFYFSNFAGITPPVALTAFGAAGIAKSDPFETGFQSMKMALPTYFLAFSFVLKPELLLFGESIAVISAALITGAGVILMALALGGAIRISLKWWERICLAIAGIALIDSNLFSNVAGFGILLVICGVYAFFWRKRVVAN